MKKIILFVLLFLIIKVEAQTSTFFTVDSLFAKGRYQLALKELNNVNKPSFLSNYKSAIIYESIDNFPKTIYFLEKALIFKDDYQTKLKLAKAYQRIKKPIKAIKIYEEILTKDSLNLVLKYQLGKLYLIAKKGNKAIYTFKNLIIKDSLNAHYSYQLGISFALKKDNNRMINSFLDTYRKDSTHLKAIVKLATSFNKLKEKDSTKIFVNKGLEIDNNHITLNKLKIKQLYRDKKYAEAIPFLLKLDTITKNDTYSTSMLGRTYYNLDSLEKADKYFRKLFSLDRENYKSFTYRGHIAIKQKKFISANGFYKMATFIGKEKRDEEFYGLGIVSYEMKKPKQAIINFDRAFSENRNNYKALYQSAKITDDYYKDKSIAYKKYLKFIDFFENKDKGLTEFVKKRISDIKKDYFLRGDKLD